MIIHLHSTCWNEERMLPFYFRHYDPIVDHYVIHDNQSTDGSLDILRRHPRVTVVPLHLEGASVIESAFNQVNGFWHSSRGKADWVAVCNIDELFWHPHLRLYLERCRSMGITWLGSKGFQMVSDVFPGPDEDLPSTIRVGVRHEHFDKPSFFNPDAITNSGFEMGRHGARPKGRVVRDAWTKIMLLHYKFIGLDYLAERHAELNARRREKDVSKGWGAHYDPAVTVRQMADLKSRSRDVIPSPETRLDRLWWGVASYPWRIARRPRIAQRNS